MNGFARIAVFALALLPLACSDTSTGPGEQTPATLELASDSEQQGAAGMPLSDSIAVKVLDRDGAGISGIKVQFAVVEGGGSISPASATTDEQGVARSMWTLGSAGENRAEAKVDGLDEPMMFVATGTKAEATVAKAGGDRQTGTVGTELPTMLTVAVTDAGGDPVSGATVTWAVTKGGGSASSATAKTDAAGEVKAAWTLGKTAGEQSVTATVNSLSDVTFTAEAEPGPLASLRIDSIENQVAIAGDTLPEPLVVRALDQFDNEIPDLTVSFTVTAGSGTLSTPETATGSKGQASTELVVSTSAAQNEALRVVASATGADTAVTDTVTFHVRRPVLIFNRVNDQNFSQVIALDWLSKAETELTRPDEETLTADLSPDGSKLAFGSFDASSDRFVLIIQDLATGTRDRLPVPGADVLFPKFSPDGTRITFSVLDSATAQIGIYYLDAGTHSLDVLGSSAAAVSAFGTSDQLFYSESSGGQWDLMRRDLSASISTRITSSASINELDVAPFANGSRLFFACAAVDENFDSVQGDICVMNTDGTDRTIVIDEPNWDDYNPTVSYDERFLAFTSTQLTSGSKADIYYVPLIGGEPQRVEGATERDEFYASFGILGWDASEGSTEASSLSVLPGFGGASTPMATEARQRIRSVLGWTDRINFQSGTAVESGPRTGHVAPLR